VRRLFFQGRGLMVLFSGPPGTGKTLAAQVIAAELGLDLFRIALLTVVSKYAGETSKNLERILSREQRLDIVLLFDEADALLGNRTEIKDAHDRFANTDTNYLLQALEDYQRVAILSTKKTTNIDEGFIRRIRYYKGIKYHIKRL
jgi:SpoVK/Ycf46/Vps4 family AAA+-type ATPase